MAKITVFKTPTTKQVASKGYKIKAEDSAPNGIPMLNRNKNGALMAFRKVKTKDQQIIRKQNPLNPNGGFDVSSIQSKNKVKMKRSGKVITKQVTRSNMNYNNPNTSKTTVVRKRTADNTYKNAGLKRY